ncbi:MAG TPA: biotin/lipoate A/B protein ligase family protein [Candidatus Binatia bacterium]
MKYLEQTWPTPEQNLACDEALLLDCEEGDGEEVVRFWEPQEHFAVLGYSGRTNAEVFLSRCREHRVPVLRRLSGGGAVLQGPGCLNYALVLKISQRPNLHDVAATNAFVMERLKRALAPVVESPIAVRGFTDLTLGARKFSGNAQYRKRRFLLFHGTFLLHFDFALVEKLLPVPEKQPGYRQNRTHGNFLANLNLPSHKIKEALKQAWSAREECENMPLAAIERLARERYSSDEWNFRF